MICYYDIGIGIISGVIDSFNQPRPSVCYTWWRLTNINIYIYIAWLIG